MDRRKSLKIIGGSVAGIAGLVFADWKWQIIDRVTHAGFFSFEEEQLISAIADTFIPEGLPPILPMADAKPIGALSTGTDQFLIKLFEKCYEKEEQELIKSQLKALNKPGFLNLSQTEREQVLLSLKNAEGEDVSTIEIKKILEQVIEQEDKNKPLPDDQLADILKEKGYPIARRTIAKYREQLDIPVARLRKKMM